MIDTQRRFHHARRSVLALSLTVAAAGCGIVPAAATTALPPRPEAQAHHVTDALPDQAVAIERGAPPAARRPPEPPTWVGVPMAEAHPEPVPSLRVPSDRWPQPAAGPWSYACSLSLDPALGPTPALAFDRGSRLTRENVPCVVFD
jgi:hypothetical protein